VVTKGMFLLVERLDDGDLGDDDGLGVVLEELSGWRRRAERAGEGKIFI
jgi:hypothetical protein